MSETPTTAQAAILETVRRNGATVFDGRKAKAVYALEAAGLVTVKVNYWYIASQKRGGKSYTVEAVPTAAQVTAAEEAAAVALTVWENAEGEYDDLVEERAKGPKAEYGVSEDDIFAAQEAAAVAKAEYERLGAEFQRLDNLAWEAQQ